MDILVKNICSMEEIKAILDELKINIDDLDNVETLLACASGGVCQTACQKGCQSCQPGNRYGHKESDEPTEEDTLFDE